MGFLIDAVTHRMGFKDPMDVSLQMLNLAEIIVRI